jgi:hypothetical protein
MLTFDHFMICGKCELRNFKPTHYQMFDCTIPCRREGWKKVCFWNDEARSASLVTQVRRLPAQRSLHRIPDLGRVLHNLHAGRFKGFHFLSRGAFAA